jgi:hypothetical protein
MALAAHDRPFFSFPVTFFAVCMESLHERRFVSGYLQFMAIGASLVFRRFIFQQIAVLINMVAFIAFLNLGRFIVFVVSENSRRPLRVFKGIFVDEHHILL